MSAGGVPKGSGAYKVGRPYQVAGTTYVPRIDPDYVEVGTASWYGSAFHGRVTANGEVYDVNGLTAAHPTLPLPSYVRVTNLENGRSMMVRVNDRGPFADDRIIDVSAAVAAKLGFKTNGTAEVQVEYVGPARLDGLDQRILLASYSESRPAWWQQAQPISPIAGAPLVLASAPPPRLSPGRLPDDAFQPMPGSTAVIPAYAPVGDPLASLIGRSTLVSMYAHDAGLTGAQRAAADMANNSLGMALARAAATKAQQIGGPPVVVQIGFFSDWTSAVHASAGFAKFGSAEVVTTQRGEGAAYVVQVSSANPQAVVAAAMDAGLPGAVVHQN